MDGIPVGQALNQMVRIRSHLSGVILKRDGIASKNNPTKTVRLTMIYHN